MSDALQITSFSIAIIRMAVHAFTGTAAILSYLSYAFPCEFSSSCSSGAGGNWSDLILALVLTYFVYDILSLPQDIFYILANNLPELSPQDALT